MMRFRDECGASVLDATLADSHPVPAASGPGTG